MQNKIPAGYRFTVKSYEGDGDNFKTVVVEGLSEPKAKLLGELVTLLCHCRSGLEGACEPTQKEREKAHSVLLPIFEKYADLFEPEQLQSFRDDVGCMQDFICDNLLGYPAEERYALRIIKDVWVDCIPYDVLIEDVTTKFVV